ncbi:hypothetical protein NQ036_06900 [Brevibacterium sp. 91QC2O2]|uniref:hypothetical protein n=1 Tax=Brevibacterium sp. 91QC2O2 TaxID=2968458 RepID=UPI00211CCF7B|nr:hypothetical protein [Brevibacterium sp. 91QC2O2]MCQ9367972.1 hypothetical protein [Brevibacterium sp. 91QC2O2]
MSAEVIEIKGGMVSVKSEGAEQPPVRLPKLFEPAPVSVTVPMGALLSACKAMLPHVPSGKAGGHPYDGVGFTFSDSWMVISGGMANKAVVRVRVHDHEGLTGGIESDRAIVQREVLTKITRLFKVPKIEGDPDPDAAITVTVHPSSDGVATNRKVLSVARRENAHINDDSLRPPAELEFADTTGIIPGEKFIAQCQPENSYIPDLMGRVLAVKPVPMWGGETMFGWNPESLGAIAATSAALGRRPVIAPTSDEELLHVTVGDRFVATAFRESMGEKRLEEEHALSLDWVRALEGMH